jgi:hypothetical protein
MLRLRSSKRLFVVPLDDPRVIHRSLKLFQLLLVFGQHRLKLGLASQVGTFVRIILNVEQFKLRPMNVLVNRLCTILGFGALLELSLPTGRAPEVRSERVGQGMRDIPD